MGITIVKQFMLVLGGFLGWVTLFDLLARHRERLARRSTVIKLVDLFFYFCRETNSMQFITTPQTAHGFTDLTDFAQPRMGIAVLDIDTRARLDAFGGIVA